jgi:hypothetical protein
LQQNPFQDSDEVRRCLPELAAVPKDVVFRTEFMQAFRASADRPGGQAAEPKPIRLPGPTGDPAEDLAGRMSGFNARIRRRLPGLPVFEASRYRFLATLLLNIGNYLGRWRSFFVELVNTRRLRVLGLLTIVGWVVFVVFPGIDLGVAGWFFDPPRSFSLGDSWVGRFFDMDIHFAMEWFLAVLVGDPRSSLLAADPEEFSVRRPFDRSGGRASDQRRAQGQLGQGAPVADRRVRRRQAVQSALHEKHTVP